MKRFAAAMLSVTALASAPSQAASLEAKTVLAALNAATQSTIRSYADAAWNGDYAAMRNMAYAWSTDAARQDPRAAIVGCAWYAEVKTRHPQRINAGDESNIELYCGRLSRDDLQAALALKQRIGQQIDAVQAGKPAANAIY